MLTVFLQLPDADIIFYPSFLDEQESIYLEGETASYRLLTELTQTINWRQDWITIKGRSMPQPRLTAWYSDSGKSYTLSDIRQTLQESDRALETRKSENLTTHDPSRPPKRLSPLQKPCLNLPTRQTQILRYVQTISEYGWASLGRSVVAAVSVGAINH